MKRIVIAAAFLCLATLFVAQAPYGIFVANNIGDAAGNKLLSGTITFTPVLTAGSTAPASPHLAGVGRVTPKPVTFNVTNGVVSAQYGTAQLADLSQTNPSFSCYMTTVHDNNSGDTWMLDPCLQPTYTAIWASVSGGVTYFNYDNYNPPGTPGTLTVAGPPGINWRGAWSSSNTYAIADGVSYSGSSYVSTAAANTTTPPGASWNLLAQQGATGPTGATGATGSNILTTATTTPITGLIKGNGTNVAQAIAGTDFDSAGAAATAQAASLQKINNLSDVSNVFAARANLGVAQATTVIQSGLIFDTSFKFSGGTLIDNSPAGNNGTVGSVAPYQLPYGVEFSRPAPPYDAGQGIYNSSFNLPTALNSASTFIFSATINNLPYSGGQPAGNWFIGNSGGQGASSPGGWCGSGNAFWLYAGNTNYSSSGGVATGTYNLSLYHCGGVTVPIGAASTGYHVFALTLGTPGSGSSCITHDRLYVDGIESSYAVQGCSAGKMSYGNYIIGDPTGGGGWPGDGYRMLAYSTALTPAQIATDSGVIRQNDIANGVAMTPTLAILPSPILMCSGDSIDSGYGASSAYCANLSLTNPPTTSILNTGISGITEWARSNSDPTQLGPLCITQTGPSVYTQEAATNDFLNISTSTPASVFGSQMSNVKKMKAAGCIVGISTMISRYGSGGGNGGATFEIDKQAYNALVRNEAISFGVDFIFDFAEDPLFGAPYANNPVNTSGTCAASTYYQSDCTHPTSAGHIVLGGDYSNAYNYQFGHNQSNPTRISASSYSMLSGDGAVELMGTGSQALTLPTCIGLSKAKYWIHSTTAYASTVAPLNSSQPINGITTTVPLAAGASIDFRAVPNPEASGAGCHWEY